MQWSECHFWYWNWVKWFNKILHVAVAVARVYLCFAWVDKESFHVKIIWLLAKFENFQEIFPFHFTQCLIACPWLTADMHEWLVGKKDKEKISFIFKHLCSISIPCFTQRSDELMRWEVKWRECMAWNTSYIIIIDNHAKFTTKTTTFTYNSEFQRTAWSNE